MNTIDLSGTWRINDSQGEYFLNGCVPGSVLFEMEKAGYLGKKGAFFRYNNRKAPAIMDRDFTYSRKFKVDDDFFAGRIKGRSLFCLEADGIDTLAEIRVNGTPVGKAFNMHRTWRFDLKDLLKIGENSIEIVFRNSLEYIRKEHERRPLVSEDPEGITIIPGFYSIRKSHCSYGWDWGPQMPDAGIWRDIRIVRYDGCRFDDLRILQNHSGAGVSVDLFAEIDIWCESDYRVSGSLISQKGEEYPFSFAPGESFSLVIDEPQLWWPNGMGDQPLYQISATLSGSDGICGTIEKTIGLRTLTIVRNSDEWGESFCFQANGVPFFCRGANYIPQDIYLNRVTKERMARLLEDCCEANFNCIRVWGGGVYPDDNFYEYCDRLGLVVWQDLMFACAIYDIRSDSFTDNISMEIRENLRRIRHHASLGLICGNNEMEWFFVDYKNFAQNKENEFEYLKQYNIIIPSIHKDVCPEIFYWSSSPSSGGYFEEPNSPDKGDCHFWAVWHGNKDLSEYKKHYFRFMSEFGFESLPSMKTIKTFTRPEDRNIFSPVMEEHQKSIGGNPKIVSYLSKYFRYPKDLDSLVYISQLSQADAICAGVEHWRRNRGRCMGSIYWQLNDNWPVASWSSIDYYGRWKALHYAVKKAYDNILLSIDGEGRKAVVHLSNESGSSTSGTLVLKLISLDGTVLSEQKELVESEARSSSPVLTFELDENYALDSVVLHAVYVSADNVYESTHFFEIYKYLELVKPVITMDVRTLTSDTVEITLNCKKPAFYVELEILEGNCFFPDNYFHLFPGITKRVEVRHEGPDTLVKQLFQVRSLVDSY